MQPERSEDHGEIFNEVRLIFPMHLVEGNHAGSRKNLSQRCWYTDREKLVHEEKNYLLLLLRRSGITLSNFIVVSRSVLFASAEAGLMIEHRGRFSLAAILDTSRVTRPLAKELFDHIFSILQPQFTLSNCMIIAYSKNKNQTKWIFCFSSQVFLFSSWMIRSRDYVRHVSSTGR